MRLEPIDAAHPNVVAAVYGPLALLAMTEAQPPLRRANLLNAKRASRRVWHVSTDATPLALRPFTEIADEPYSAYVRVT